VWRNDVRLLAANRRVERVISSHAIPDRGSARRAVLRWKSAAVDYRSNGCCTRGALCPSAVVLTGYEKGEATAIATRQLGSALALNGCKGRPVVNR
jgi:hypothetical protein